jgi:ubiquitin C-terminal hydrolase
MIKKKNYEEAKKEVDLNNPVNKTLNYFYETIYKCPKNASCYSIQNDSSITFDLVKISKNIQGKIDLYHCFDYNFRVIDNNQFYCSKCQCQHNNKSQDKLLSLPKVLTIFLNRGKGKKYQENVEFYEKINIQKYVDDCFIKADKRQFNYKLIGVSTYIEITSSKIGHYMAYCYRENDKKYYCFNDTNVEPVSFNQIKNNGEPSILFYEQIKEDNNNNELN